jgi:tartrate-resistant acid phosphatase type 5
MRLIQTFRARVAVACTVLSLSLFSHAAIAQNQRASFGGDSLQVLMAPMSPAARQAAEQYLAANDSVAGVVIRNMTRDTTAIPFLLAILKKDPFAGNRRLILQSMEYREHFHRAPGVLDALRDRVRHDSDPAIVGLAGELLHKAAVAQIGLRDLLAERIASARAANDTAMLRFAMDEDDAQAHAEVPVIAPAFLRNPPPVFSVVPSGKSIRFVAFGDYGYAHLSNPRYPSHQGAVAATIRAYMKKHPFNFGITTGDNFYPTSFPSPEDPNWKISWVDQYDDLGFPFYISLGNHDWYEPNGPVSEHMFSRTSKSWKFPAYYYTYTAGPAQFFAINTNALTEKQLHWLRTELAKSKAKWKIVYGHFPAYEQMNDYTEPQQKLLVPIFKEFGVDLYMCGHHHTMQHWNVDGVDYAVAGAGGAVNYPLNDSVKVGRRFMMSAPGFAAVEANESSLTVRFIGLKEQLLYEYTRKK